MLDRQLADPWLSFLTHVNEEIEEAADLHCVGGFVVSQCYGLGRETADLDVLAVIPHTISELIIELAGERSRLHKKHRVFIDLVRVANYPASYEDRLVRVYPVWSKLRLWALEPHDLALSKLDRSDDRDIRDVISLAQLGFIQPDILMTRFETEMEPYITGRTTTWYRTTLRMWVDACWPK